MPLRDHSHTLGDWQGLCMRGFRALPPPELLWAKDEERKWSPRLLSCHPVTRKPERASKVNPTCASLAWLLNIQKRGWLEHHSLPLAWSTHTVQPLPTCLLFPGRANNTDEPMPRSCALESEVQSHLRASYQMLNNDLGGLNGMNCVKSF